MDIQERIDTISASFKELPAAEQNALLRKLKEETVASREKRLAEIEKEMMELQGYQDQLSQKYIDLKNKSTKEIAWQTDIMIHALWSIPEAFDTITGRLYPNNKESYELAKLIEINKRKLEDMGYEYISPKSGSKLSTSLEDFWVHDSKFQASA